MEFNEKLQELRKQKGITQEELAESLYVSRTAISKWESSRGYPNIESLKAIAKFYGVTVDDLLSGNELLSVAEEDNRQKTRHFQDLVFGLLDLSVVIFLFLPLFGQEINGEINSVSLMNFSGIPMYIKVSYFTIIIGIVLSGIAVLALQTICNKIWEQSKHKISLALTIFGILLFIISRQPYAAILLFIYLIVKTAVLLKKQ